MCVKHAVFVPSWLPVMRYHTYTYITLVYVPSWLPVMRYFPPVAAVTEKYSVYRKIEIQSMLV